MKKISQYKTKTKQKQNKRVKCLLQYERRRASSSISISLIIIFRRGRRSFIRIKHLRSYKNFVVFLAIRCITIWKLFCNLSPAQVLSNTLEKNRIFIRLPLKTLSLRSSSCEYRRTILNCSLVKMMNIVDLWIRH